MLLSPPFAPQPKKIVPLLAICRGIQELNVALGGTLATEIQTQKDKMDTSARVG